jgi:two-component system cell cycle response regulator CtrA
MMNAPLKIEAGATNLQSVIIRQAKHIEELEIKLSLAEERCAMLGSALVNEMQIPSCLRLSPMERNVLRVFLTHKTVTKERLFTALYGLRAEADQPEVKTLDVHICYVRKALREFKIEIQTVWGEGWRMLPEEKSKIAALLEKENGAAS